ncbi:MAG: alpha/beta hydrolase [Tissierellia bacterium]|nr:alpha/beta hydrolase [Tissierellia bacterium]
MKEYFVHYINLDNGEKIAYRKSGKGIYNIVLVHGNMSSSVHFQVLMEKIEDRFTVYALDLPGFGDSTYNKELNSLREMSKYLVEFIEKLNIDKTYLLGWSTGGGVVMEAAADIPEKVQKIFLLSSVGVHGYPMFRKDENFQPILTERVFRREDIAIDPVQVLPVLQAYETKNKDFFKHLWESLIYTDKVPQGDEYDKYLDAILKQRNLVDIDVSLTNFNITHVNNGVVDGSGRIDLIKAPVVIIHGENDLVVPVDFARLSKQFFGDRAELVVIENAGHSILTDNLSKLAELIK